MIANENNTGISEFKIGRPSLEIRLHFVDGSKKALVRAKPNATDAILHQINPGEQ
jgi:hypothetical protein